MVRGVRQAQNPDAAQTAQGPMVPARLGGLARRMGDMRIAAPAWPRRSLGHVGFLGLAGLAEPMGLARPMDTRKFTWEKKRWPALFPRAQRWHRL